MDEDKKVVITPDRDVLTKHRNDFQKTLLGTLLNLKSNLDTIKVNPKAKVLNSQGQPQPIQDAINGQKKEMENSRKYVLIIDELLEKEKAGTLSTEWVDVDFRVEEE